MDRYLLPCLEEWIFRLFSIFDLLKFEILLFGIFEIRQIFSRDFGLESSLNIQIKNRYTIQANPQLKKKLSFISHWILIQSDITKIPEAKIRSIKILLPFLEHFGNTKWNISGKWIIEQWRDFIYLFEIFCLFLDSNFFTWVRSKTMFRFSWSMRKWREIASLEWMSKSIDHRYHVASIKRWIDGYNEGFETWIHLFIKFTVRGK